MKKCENTVKCSLVDQCAFFKHFENKCENLIERLKETYCLSDNSKCSRLYLQNILGKQAVPLTMLPHQWEWANQILIDIGKPDAICNLTKDRELESSVK